MAKRPDPRATLTPAQVAWLLATGLAAYLPLAPRVPLWLAGLAAAAFLWRAALAWLHRPLPPRWLLILITLAATAAVFFHYRSLFGQQPGLALLLIFMALKQLEARLPRDGLTIVLLAYFLTLAQFFEDQSILLAVTTLATVLIATAALASLADAETPPLQLLRRAGLLLLQATPLLLIAFVLFPRVDGPLWGLPRDAHAGLTGLSDTMAPGMISELSQSDAIAFRVVFDGAEPPKRDLYWRGPVLTRLDGRVWRPTAVWRADDWFYAPLPDSPRYRYTVTLEAHNKPWLFALELPSTLPDAAVRTSDFQLHALKPVTERRRYTLESHARVDFDAESPAVLAAALALPAGSNPRSVALAAGWRVDPPEQRLTRALAFLREQRLVYTLRPPLTSEHVADDFLFVTRRGFCEHFAAAFVILMRAAGVPARVVTGYQGGEKNPVDGTWVVRQSDAHAWAEVWLESRGWLRVDPTAAAAPARIEDSLAAALPAGEPLPLLARPGFDWLRTLRYRWWAVSHAWQQWVLGYDAERQRSLLTRMGMSAPDWRTMALWLAALSSLALAALALGLLWQRPRRDAIERAWRRCERRLARRGLARLPWEGPYDYAERVARELPAAAADIRAIAACYARLRYGVASDALRAELRHRVASFDP